MQRAGAGVSEAEFEIHDLIAEGDRVAARLTTSARHTGTFMGIEPTGKRYSIDEIHIFRIRDGQVVEHWHAFDTASADGPAQGRNRPERRVREGRARAEQALAERRPDRDHPEHDEGRARNAVDPEQRASRRRGRAASRRSSTGRPTTGPTRPDRERDHDAHPRSPTPAPSPIAAKTAAYDTIVSGLVIVRREDRGERARRGPARSAPTPVRSGVVAIVRSPMQHDDRAADERRGRVCAETSRLVSAVSPNAAIAAVGRVCGGDAEPGHESVHAAVLDRAADDEQRDRADRHRDREADDQASEREWEREVHRCPPFRLALGATPPASLR